MVKRQDAKRSIPVYSAPDAELVVLSYRNVLMTSTYEENYDGVDIESPEVSGTPFNW